MKVEARIEHRSPDTAGASVRIELPEGGISINDIYVRDRGGKLHVSFPLDRQRQPTVYLRGTLKQKVHTAITQAYRQGAEDADIKTQAPAHNPLNAARGRAD